MKYGKLQSLKHKTGSIISIQAGRNTFLKDFRKIATFTLIGSGILELLFAAAYLAAFHNPTPNQLPIGIVTSTINTKPVATTLEKSADGAFKVQQYTAMQTAQNDLKQQKIYAIYSPAFPGSTIIIASANGQSVSKLLASTLATFDSGVQQQMRLQMARDPLQAPASQTPITEPAIHNIAPLVSGDGGAAVFYTAFPAVFGGYIAAVALNLVRGKRKFTKQNALIRTLGFACAAIITSIGVALIAIHGVDAIPSGDFWAVSGVLAATYFGVAMFSSGLISLMGIIGTALVIVLFVILGNPASGGVVPMALTGSGPWHLLSPVLPTGAAVSAIRQIVYYDGMTVWPHLGVLVGYSLVGLLALMTISKGKSSINFYESEIVHEVEEEAEAEVKDATKPYSKR